MKKITRVRHTEIVNAHQHAMNHLRDLRIILEESGLKKHARKVDASKEVLEGIIPLDVKITEP